MDQSGQKNGFPALARLGLDGVLLRFADRLSDRANQQALAAKAALQADPVAGVKEIATSLASVYLRFDPAQTDFDTLSKAVRVRLATAERHRAAPGRRRWVIPTVFGGTHGPQLDEAAALAGCSADAAIAMFAATPLRVMSLGFAPGQPYLGQLPENWDIPRQTGLTRAVPVGALTVAIRQSVLFATPAPTGWRHIGQTAFQAFQPESADPFRLRPGDEVLFAPASADDLHRQPPRMEPLA